MLVKSGEGMHEYRVIRNGVGEILMVNKFGPDETANRCKMVAELNLAPGVQDFMDIRTMSNCFICLKESLYV